MSDTTVVERPDVPVTTRTHGDRRRRGLVIAWCHAAPERVGEVGWLPGPGDAPAVLGRGEGSGEPRIDWVRARPGMDEARPALGLDSLSRRHLVVGPSVGGEHEVTCTGRVPVRLNGRRIERGRLRPGDTLHIEGTLVLLLDERPESAPTPTWGPSTHPFGGPDPCGLVGESPAAWALREQLAFAAARPRHTLLLGESGTGKEVAARALHRLSGLGGPFVARNAATLPEALVDAELFGNRKGYPNPGMPERAGLIGDADGGFLFLDEIAELPEASQVHLLRVLDADGEYTRLGESHARRSAFRMVGATNQAPEALRHDVLARFPLRVQLPPLKARRADIPLLAHHLLGRITSENPDLADRFLRDGRLRVGPGLVDALLRWRFTTHLRELERLLWEALAESSGDWILPPRSLRGSPPPRDEEPAPVDPDALSRAQIVAALDRHDGNRSRAWKELGLSSRYALLRLLKKHGL